MIRLVAPLTVALGVLTLVTALAVMMVAVPLAMATMITGFCWYVERPRPARSARAVHLVPGRLRGVPRADRAGRALTAGLPDFRPRGTAPPVLARWGT